MSLRERDSSPRVRTSAGERLSHPAQAVLIAALLRPDLEERGIPGSVPWVPLDLAREAGYSRMTASRVARELVAANLVSAQREGRETKLRFLKARRSLWAVALPRCAHHGWHLPILQHHLRGIVPRCTGNAAARMGARTAQVEPGQGAAIAGLADHRSCREQLVGTECTVENVATDQAEDPFKIQR
ncbi:hypothetical protein G6F68_009883 [Rhizopus microsporus]|nr:hypothetical protein G6F68_009883 [Rhizopus microsporus]